jgi:hypothetical protein
VVNTKGDPIKTVVGKNAFEFTSTFGFHIAAMLAIADEVVE